MSRPSPRSAPPLLFALLAANRPAAARGGWHPLASPHRGTAAPLASRGGGPPRRWLVVVAAGVIEVATPPRAGAVVLCQGAADCGDGALGHGAVCDEVAPVLVGEAEEPWGLCREACRDDDDCSGDARCQDDLDPESGDWSGCVPDADDDPL